MLYIMLFYPMQCEGINYYFVYLFYNNLSTRGKTKKQNFSSPCGEPHEKKKASIL